MLTQEQRKQLLQIAREAIEEAFTGRTQSDRKNPGRMTRAFSPGLDAELSRPSGAFVSLHAGDGDLRGCIGSIHPVAPLCDAVASNAVHAAFRDPRFDPLRQDDLPDLRIEISVMSAIEVVTEPGSIEVGRDGLIVSSRGRTGLLLPQVASERGWSRETFLSQTCVKAGLSADAWRSPGCLIEKFSAEVFCE